jgi:tRNA pseudouridine55 synthase
MDGILVIDKPVGPTSHDVVEEVKSLLGAKKVGHLGTLDPAASGVLPLVINRATKFASQLSGGEKIYEFDLILGCATDTDDDQGKIIREGQVLPHTLDQLQAVIKNFMGEISQIPPSYSAVKINGRPLYKSARAGKFEKADPRIINIYELTICTPHPDPLPQGEREKHISPSPLEGEGWGEGDRFCIRMRLRCSPGTYVRALCRDIGEEMGCFGHAANIRRLKSGIYNVEEAIELNLFSLLPSAERISKIRPIELTL